MDRAEAATLAHQLMNQHGLIMGGWTFEYDRSVSRFGCCHYGKRKITLSAHLVGLNTVDQVHDVILHEIAHALAPRGAHHDERWKEVCRRIGADPSRCYNETGPNGVKTPEPKWLGKCPVCSFTIKRHRLKQSAKLSACPRCCEDYNNGKFDSRFRIRWTENRVNPVRSVEFVDTLPQEA